MAFLNNITFRPSCIVSALPERFRVALEKELSDSVAISTCQISQLENAVKLRGATIAVVGASNESFDIAERLSHEAHSVRVFLVHYQDCLAGRAETNGFAGVFDLRVEPKRLAQSIRQEALQPTRHLHQDASEKPSQRGILRHFITMQERLSTPQLLMESMLDGFLDIASAHSGVLLAPSDSDHNRFKVLASRGEDVPQVLEQVTFPEETILQMLKGATLFFPEGIPYSDAASWCMDSGFSIGVPLVADNKLLGCLLAVTNQASENLTDYGMAASHILSQLRQREAAAQRERLISQARQLISPGWLLATESGRVIYREGDQTNLLCNSFSEITAARLKHALTDAQTGHSGSVRFRDSLISYQPIRLNDIPYALLSFAEGRLREQTGPAHDPIITGEVADFMKFQLGGSTQRNEFIEAIIQDLQAGMEKRRPVNLEALASFGIQLSKGSHEIPDKIAADISLLLMAFARIIRPKISFTFYHGNNKWAITYEYEENSLSDAPIEEALTLPEHPLIKMIFQTMGPRIQQPNWRFGTYGGRCECKYAKLK
jgi:hypothetical protein